MEGANRPRGKGAKKDKKVIRKSNNQNLETYQDHTSVEDDQTNKS